MTLWKRLKNLWILSTYTLPENEIERKGLLYEKLVKPRHEAKIITPNFNPEPIKPL